MSQPWQNLSWRELALTYCLTAASLVVVFAIIPLVGHGWLPNRWSDLLPGPIWAAVAMAAFLVLRWWRAIRAGKAHAGNGGKDVPPAKSGMAPDSVASQSAINEAEGGNPRNWTGPKWLSIYFSKRDSRAWVPKQIPALGWTVNLGNPRGALALLAIVGAIFLALVVVPLAIFKPTASSLKPAAVLDLEPVTNNFPGLTGWRWKCTVPAQHVLSFTFVSFPSNGAPAVNEELSSWFALGAIKVHELTYEMTRQDCAMLSPICAIPTDGTEAATIMAEGLTIRLYGLPKIQPKEALFLKTNTS